MADRQCVFCGRLIDLEKYALFRLPPDHRRVPDEVCRTYLEIRGINRRYDLPETCGIGSAETAKIVYENGKPVLTTKTGRSTDTLICPSCHNEVLRDTIPGSINTAVFFGGRNSGKTSLVTALANECITSVFSYDDRYRYIFCDSIYDSAFMTDAAVKISSGAKPADLRDPVAVFRMTSAAEGSRVVCDVMHDVSPDDTEDDFSIAFTLPFAADAGQFVYCIPADTLADTVVSLDKGEDMRLRLGLDAMTHALREDCPPPKLVIAVTKFDLCEKSGGAAADLLAVRDNEKALLNYIYTAFPCVREYEGVFDGIRVFTVSAVSPITDGEGVTLTQKLYSGLFG